MTETTQPDPRIVAWMRERMETPLGLTGKDVRAYRVATGASDEAMRAACDVAMNPAAEPEDPRRDALRCIECEFRADDSPGGWFDLTDHRDQTGHRYELAKPAPKPLTLADIPAGQGASSLFIAPDSTGVPRVYYKDEDGDITAWSYSADSRHGAARAMWGHLAATLPTVDETP